MSKLSYFLSDKAQKVMPEQVIVTKRYLDENGDPVPFTIKAISSQEEANIKKNHSQMGAGFDYNAYTDELICACTVEPDFKNVELQDSYGVADDISLMKAILILPGEREELSKQIQRINGYETDITKLMAKAKN